MKRKRIGIDISRAFSSCPTGIEKYTSALLENFFVFLKEEQVTLYVRKDAKIPWKKIPKTWHIKEIRWRFFWTQIGLSWEMLFSPVEVLFVPSHTIPWISPKKTVVTIHGLEYERIPKGYSWYARTFMRFFVRRSCERASRIIAVSEATKKDIISFYHIDPNKITVVYEGPGFFQEKDVSVSGKDISKKLKEVDTFFLYLGRLEYRKNIIRIIEAFSIIKKRKKIKQKLILAGSPGYGYKDIKKTLRKSSFSKDILELGYVNEQEKIWLLKNADILIFVSLSEGFGLPIMEAQKMGIPLVVSDLPVFREIAGEQSFFVDFLNSNDISEKIGEVLDNSKETQERILLGKENVRRFSWEKSAQEVSSIIKKECYRI
ncbi:MAG: glycosyltransferase family 4 protein [Candidatus Moraniibacteriota bacterium]|nr:MAG: glycosyltransferase family 4 protein [Candidatus Moranbacteria bacterium]